MKTYCEYHTDELDAASQIYLLTGDREYVDQFLAENKDGCSGECCEKAKKQIAEYNQRIHINVDFEFTGV